ncbi:MAG: MBL fold metallo-hydrolase [Quisquiliibacterium sp.]
MRFCSLGSGSEGNALLVECEIGARIVRLLIDCGFSPKEFGARLSRFDLRPAQIDAILVTHEHGDHIGGAPRLAAAESIALYMTAGTALAGLKDQTAVPVNLIDSHACLQIGGVCIEPVPVPHDAREPVQFVIDDGKTRLGVLTDLGRSTPHVIRAMSRLDAIMLECNHDSAMLQASDYPETLKRRIAGGYGHLANEASAKLLAQIDHSRLHTVVAAHLSRKNNHPDLARQALAGAWGQDPDRILVADQDCGLAWVAL